MEVDRRNRVSPLLNDNNWPLLTPEKKVSLQEYASRWGLGFFTFPSDCTCGGHDDNSDDKENGSDIDTDESEDRPTQAEWLRGLESSLEADILDPSMPKIKRRKI
jgi:hypothetical protein